MSPDTPSSPSIGRVEPYSSSAQVEFDEPEATGGVPILRYKAEWRALGEGDWHSRLYDAKEGRSDKKTCFLPHQHQKKIGFPVGKSQGGWRVQAPDEFLNICCG